MITTRQFAADMPAPQLNPSRIFRCLAGIAHHPVQSYRWFLFINTHPVLSNLTGLVPDLLSKIHQPYMSPGFDCPSRVALLMNHYKLVQEAGFGRLTRRAAVQPLRLFSIIGKSGARYWIELSTTGDHRQAGEWVLRLVSRNICVYTVTFLFTEEQGVKQIMVGSLTGMLSMGRKMGIRQATWDFYGWRPKDMMVSLVREIGTVFGCSKTVLLGNRNKLPITDVRFCKKSSDYDRTWKELNASARSDGNFELPDIAAEAVCSQAQAVRTKRDALIESVRRTLRIRLSEQRSAPATSIPVHQLDMESKRA